VNKGQTVTDYWRVVTRGGGLAWLQSRATLVCNAKSLDDQHVVFVNYVIRYSQAGAGYAYHQYHTGRPSQPSLSVVHNYDCDATAATL